MPDTQRVPAIVLGLAPDPFGSLAVSTRDDNIALQASGSARLRFRADENYEKTLFSEMLVDKKRELPGRRPDTAAGPQSGVAGDRDMVADY